MAEASTILDSKILIVDDQQANVQLLELMLQRAGYLDVTSTTDPTAVCALHQVHHYDLILLDLHMPGMDGFEVMKALKATELDEYLSVLVITAQPGHKLRALEAGARDFVSKPFDRSEVLTRIHNLLEVRLLHAKCRVYSALLEQKVDTRTAELRTSEEMFRELAANIPEALWIRDVEHQTIQYVNPAWRNLSGMSAAAGDPVESVYHIIHPDDLQWVTHERRKTPGGQASSEYRLVRPDQSVRWVHARSFPIANPSGGAAWARGGHRGRHRAPGGAAPARPSRGPRCADRPAEPHASLRGAAGIAHARGGTFAHRLGPADRHRRFQDRERHARPWSRRYAAARIRGAPGPLPAPGGRRRPARRRRIRGHRAHARQRPCRHRRRRQDSKRAARPFRARRSDGCGDDQHRDRELPGRRRRAQGAHPLRRRGDVRSQGGGPQRLPLLYRGDERAGAGEVRHRRRAAAGTGARRVRPLLPAENGHRQRGVDKRRSAAAGGGGRGTAWSCRVSSYPRSRKWA